jgi:putative tryptophan/tyrosine transport system substrate-binding protein
LEEAGGAHGVQIESVEVPTPGTLDTALAAVASDRPDALMVVPSRSMTFAFGRIDGFAVWYPLPVVSGWREFAEAGAVLTYGPDRFEAIEHCATQVDKILTGAKPGDLPVLQPTKFDLVINLNVARALGLTLPPTLLQQATEVIQ